MAVKSRTQRTKHAAKKRPAKARKSSAKVVKVHKQASATGVVEAALAVFAHEVRTPLTGILAISDLLATSELGERERRWVDTIKAGAEHLASLGDAVRGRRQGPQRLGQLARGFVRPAGAGTERRQFAGRSRGGEGVACRDRHIGRAARARDRRSRATARGAGEPDRQCGEIHRERQGGAVGGAGARQDQEQGRRDVCSLRQWHRPDPAGNQAPVPSVLAGQRLDCLALWRRGAGAVLGQAACAHDGRRHRGGAAPRRRDHVHARR